MPELPEVETVRRGLVPAMEGRRILAADIRRADLRWPFPPRMRDRLEGARVKQLRRRSKYILVDLSSDETLLIHLGMSGRMTVSGQAPGIFLRPHSLPERHDHVILDMEGDAKVTFNDPRRFGMMDLVATAGAESHRLLSRLGPEPLGNAFDAVSLAELLRGRRTPIKAALLDQRLVAGLGNIYASEALHRAGISPRRAAGHISPRRLAVLVAAIRDVLAEAIEAGGSSLRDHRQATGELGYFQHNFRVYDRAGAPCDTPDCGTSIARIVQSGRATYYCPRCQR